MRRFGPGRANDGVIHGVSDKGAIDYKGWSYGGNLQHAQFLIAFDRACVLKMESLVLRELGWKLNDVVPCAYVPRFLTILGYRPGASDGDHLRLCSRRVLFSHWFPYDRVRVVNFIP